MKRYALIYFVPDPYVGNRVAIGALIEDKQVSVVQGAPVCVCHGPTAEMLCKIALHDIAQHTDKGIFALPYSVGPQFTLGEPRDIPEGTPDPEDWVRQLLLRKYRP